MQTKGAPIGAQIPKELKSGKETEIEAFDWAFAMQNAHSNWTLPSGTVNSLTKKDILNKLISDLTPLGVSRGKISNTGATKKFERKSVSDWTWKMLREETNNSCYIDNGELYIVYENEYFSSLTNELSSETGLLGSPKKSETYVVAESIFEPTLRVGQSIILNTSGLPLVGTSITQSKTIFTLVFIIFIFNWLIFKIVN
jgi:hypothetical protein